MNKERGRCKILNENQIELLIQRYQEGEDTIDQICRDLEISQPGLYVYLKREKDRGRQITRKARSFKTRAGRPKKLDPEQIRSMLKRIEQGHPYPKICDQFNISSATLAKYIRSNMEPSASSGRIRRLHQDQLDQLLQMRRDGKSPKEISGTLNISKDTYYNYANSFELRPYQSLTLMSPEDWVTPKQPSKPKRLNSNLKLNPSQTQLLLDLYASGEKVEAIGQRLNIGRATVYRYLRWARETGRIRAEPIFSSQIDATLASLYEGVVRIIAGKSDPRGRKRRLDAAQITVLIKLFIEQYHIDVICRTLQISRHLYYKQIYNFKEVIRHHQRHRMRQWIQIQYIHVLKQRPVLIKTFERIMAEIQYTGAGPNQKQKVGRKFKLNENQIEKMIRLRREGTSIEQICRQFKLGRSTCFKYMQEYRKNPSLPQWT